MANNDSPYNFGDPVWKPVPRDKDAPFAQTSSGSWTWPKPSGKTSAKGPDWGGNSGKGARKSVISQTSNPAPVKWYDYPDPNGPTPEETMSVAYDNFMANDRAQSVINSAADRYNSTFNPQVLDPTLPPRPPKEISRPPSPIESSWYKPTLWSTLPPPTSIEETLARQAAESGFNLVPYTGPAAADLAQVHAQPLNQNFGYFGAGYHPEYLPPQTGGQPTILAQVELDPQVRYGPPGTATPVTLEEVPIEKTRNPFEIIRRAVMGAIARADNQEPGNGVYSGGAIRGQDASGTGPPVPPPSPYIPPESPHAFRPTLPEPVDTAMLESWFGVSGDPAPTFDQVAGSLGYNIDDPLQFMYDEIDNWGWAASGSKDAVAGLYEELLRDNSLRAPEPSNGILENANDWVGEMFAGPDNQDPSANVYPSGGPQRQSRPSGAPPTAGKGGYGADSIPPTTTPPSPPAQQFEYGQPTPLSPEELLEQQMEGEEARKEAEALEYEREQAEEEAALAIERALTGNDYRDLSDDEQTFLDYGWY